MNKCIPFIAIALGLSWATSEAQAATISYVLNGTGASGTIGSTSFSGKDFTLTATADTSTLANRNVLGQSIASVQFTSMIYEIAGSPAAVASAPSNFYLMKNVLPNSLAFANIAFSASNVWQNTDASSWDLVSNFTSATNPFQGSGAFATNQGQVNLTNWSSATFTANSSSATAVPEPFTIIGTLVGSTAALRMRKKLKAVAK